MFYHNAMGANAFRITRQSREGAEMSAESGMKVAHDDRRSLKRQVGSRNTAEPPLTGPAEADDIKQ